MTAEPVTTLDGVGPVCGRRDRKKLATRQALRFAALDLVAARGYAKVTVEDIAEAADVSTRTFFNYFPSKEAAVIGADPERIEELLSSLRQRPPSESALQALSAVMMEYAATIEEELGDLGEGREAWFRRLSIVRQDPDLHGTYVGHIAEIERSLCDTLATRLGRDPQHDPYPALVTGTVLTAARVAGLYWSANGGTESLAALTRASFDSLANGLAENDELTGAVPSVNTKRRKAR